MSKVSFGLITSFNHITASDVGAVLSVLAPFFGALLGPASARARPSLSICESDESTSQT